MPNAGIDDNSRQTLTAVSSVDQKTIVDLWADPITHRLLVDFASGSGTVTSVAAGNGMNFTTITTSGSVTLGTPSSITSTSTNAVTTTSHTHAIDSTILTTASSLDASKLSGTIPSTVLGNSSLYLGTTSVALNRASAALSLAGVSIDGSSASLSVAGQTGLITLTGITSTSRAKTVRDAADTILELGGSYTPTGTWTWSSATWSGVPTLNQDTTGSAVYWKTSGTGKGAITGPASGQTRTYTFPDANSTIARTDAAQTFTGTQTFSQVLTTSNAITAATNAATVPITSKVNTVTNDSAATLTITMTTTSATDGQVSIVRILDYSAAAQTIAWVNTENSTVTAPTTSNGSTTLPLTVGFQYNNATSKWRCLASA